MLYWVIYDITENKVRSKVVSICKNYGLKRVQKSAFLGEITKNKIEMLAIEVSKIVNSLTDCVFVVPSCNTCFKEKIISGKFDEKSVKHQEFLIFGGEIAS